MGKILKFIISIVVCQLAGAIGAVVTVPAIGGWYSALNKPEITPPGWVFGPAWTVLYFLMGIALYLVWEKNWEARVPAAVKTSRAWNRFSRKLFDGDWRRQNVILIFAIQSFLNILWSLLFFELKSPGVAFFELLMLWVAILYTIINFWRVSKPAGYLLVPYLFWVAFAGYLNFSIWMMN